MTDFTAVDRLMREGCRNGIFPGAALHITRSRESAFSGAYGVANLYTRAPVSSHTFFDLASLTKPLATTLGIMTLMGQGRLRLHTTLGDIFPIPLPEDKSSITIRSLLCHISGFADYHPYFRELREIPPAKRRSRLRDLIFGTPLAYETGERTLYSDIGFIVLGWVIEILANQSLDEMVSRSVYDPLHLRRLCFSPLEKGVPPDEIAATEFCKWRRRLMVGEVHDDNAHVLGGVTGHAGLFGTAPDVDKLLSFLLDGFHGRSSDHLLASALIRTVCSAQPDSTMALGFDRPSKTGSSAGRYFSSLSVGHLGYTGVSFWVELSREIIVTLLTNRVHPSRDNEKIKAFRPVLHNAVMAALGME